MGVTNERTNHKRSHSVPSALYLSKAGPQNSGTDFAAMVFDNRPHNLRSLKEAEAVFKHNNDTRAGLSPWDLVNLNPFPLSTIAFNQWQTQKQSIGVTLNANPGLFDFLLTTTYEEQQMMLKFAETADKSGWKVGRKEILAYTGHGVSLVDGYAATGEKSLSVIQRLGNELMDDAVKAHGKDILQKKNLKTLEAFLKNNPKYNALLKSIEDLPGVLSRNLGHIQPTLGGVYANARFARNEIFLPTHNTVDYLHKFGSLLNNKIIRLGRGAAATTWFIPAAIGVYKVYDAPQDLKLQTAASETVGIVAGAGGTMAGIVVGNAIVTAGIITGLFVLSGPAAFIVVGLVAGAGGIAGSELGSKGTEFLIKSMGL